MKYNMEYNEPKSLDRAFARAGIDLKYYQSLLATARMLEKSTDSIEEAKKHLRKIAKEESEEYIFQKIKECQGMQE